MATLLADEYVVLPQTWPPPVFLCQVSNPPLERSDISERTSPS